MDAVGEEDEGKQVYTGDPGYTAAARNDANVLLEVARLRKGRRIHLSGAGCLAFGMVASRLGGPNRVAGNGGSDSRLVTMLAASFWSRLIVRGQEEDEASGPCSTVQCDGLSCVSRRENRFQPHGREQRPYSIEHRLFGLMNASLVFCQRK
ncbi:hypothetical protein MTO96_034898 [Rhipicephalus appendiculatus]